MTQLNEFNRDDRDMLIRLETKMDQVITDVKDLKTGTAVKLADLEKRMGTVEKWQGDQKVNIKWIVGIASAASGIVTFIISQLISINELITKTH